MIETASVADDARKWRAVQLAIMHKWPMAFRDMTQMRYNVPIGRRTDKMTLGEMSYIPHIFRRRPLWAAVLAVGLMLPAYALAQTPASPDPDILLKLPRDLSPWGMFMAADIVVKAVMVGLVFASVLTWTIWFAKAIELMTARRRLRRGDRARSTRRARGPKRPRACKRATTARRP